jgi:hypothetical protein
MASLTSRACWSNRVGTAGYHRFGDHSVQIGGVLHNVDYRAKSRTLRQSRGVERRHSDG